MKTNVFRNNAVLKPSDGVCDSETELLLPPWTPLVVPIANRYIRSNRPWKFYVKRLGEDHVDPDVHIRHSFSQRLRAVQAVDEQLEEVHDVGLPRVETRQQRMQRSKEIRESRKKMKADSSMERASRLQTLDFDPFELEQEDVKADGGEDVSVARSCAEHYGVFEDLFGGHAVFDNVVHLDVEFDVAGAKPDHSGFVETAPVFYGNVVDAVNCADPPTVTIHGDDDDGNSLWTLVMTSPDQNFVQPRGELLHWMVGNIPGSSVDAGTTLVPYLPPFPPKGVGRLRYVFVLYKQETRLDFSALTDVSFQNEAALTQRSFSSYQFLREHQHVLTPASQCFFQAEHDRSTKDVFYDVLNMKEPTYDYDWPEPYKEPQKRQEHRAAFNEYLDDYRDRKDINEQVLKRRLSLMVSPFAGYPPKDAWPNAVFVDSSQTPTWLKDEIAEERLRRGKWRDLEIRD